MTPNDPFLPPKKGSFRPFWADDLSALGEVEHIYLEVLAEWYIVSGIETNAYIELL